MSHDVKERYQKEIRAQIMAEMRVQVSKEVKREVDKQLESMKKLLSTQMFDMIKAQLKAERVDEL